MKKILMITALTAAAALFTTGSSAQSANCAPKAPSAKSQCGSCCKPGKCAAAQKYIGTDAAINAALSHAGLERAKVRDLKCELDRENGIMVYEVEFESGLYDYEYDIEATTGKILKSKKELD